MARARARGVPSPSRRAPAPGDSERRPRARELGAEPGTVHWGFYSAALAPILTVRSGERLRLTDGVRPHPSVLEAAGISPGLVPEGSRRIWREMQPDLGPHILVGPVAVEGAEPGDTLEVHFESVDAAVPYAVNMQRPGQGLLPEDFPEEWHRVVPLDLKRRRARLGPGIGVPLAPFFGNVGVAPDAGLGRVSSMVPGPHGGNLDLKELTAGSALFLPVQVAGALFSAGDGHAAQGDGEVDLSALEAALTGTLRLVLRKDLRLRGPAAETPTHVITMGFDPDLDVAAREAVRAMLDYLGRTQPLAPQEAYMLCSAVVDLHVTQVVNGVKGIHAMLPKAVFDAPPSLAARPPSSPRPRRPR